LAGGISSARIERLARTRDEALNPSCHATTQYTRALQKAGADAGLIQSLVRQNRDRKPAAPACAYASPAAQVAALVHDKKFDYAEDKIRTLLRDDGGVASPNNASPNNALLQFVLGTILRRQSRFDEALDAFTESSLLIPGFPETHSQLSYLFYRTDDSAEALAEARTALSMDPANAEAYRYLGLALYSGGHYDAALHAFDEALAREPA